MSNPFQSERKTSTARLRSPFTHSLDHSISSQKSTQKAAEFHAYFYLDYRLWKELN